MRDLALRHEARQAALARAISFVEAAQDSTGEIPVFTSVISDPRRELTRDPSIFPTALTAQALANIPQATGVCDRAIDFLLRERHQGGLWSHWPRSHRLSKFLPPDLDDTSCATQALAEARVDGGAARSLLLSNRARSGLFYTWFIPRPRAFVSAQIGLALRQIVWPAGLIAMFMRTSARPNDIDAVVNANALYCLGRFEGDERVVAFLRDVLRDGSERHCDKWYDNPFVVRYFLARALASIDELPSDVIAARTEGEEPETALETAMHISTLSMARLPVDEELVAALIGAQCGDGSWPRAPLYHGGRRRNADGTFAPPHPDTPQWGSNALTTVFAIEALAHSARI